MVEDVFGIVGSVQAGTFRVENAVAEGGFAVIYRAHHTGFRANVALKCLKIPGSMDADDQKAFLSSFREEAELLFHLSSALPTVVRPLQVGTIDSKLSPFVPFIALEWLEGTTLDHLISERAERKEAPMPIDEAIKLLTPVAEALDKAHQFPAPGRDKKVCIVHRDLKPENIFVANVHGDRVAKILDFGIAKVKSAATQVIGHQSAKQDALVAFTPAYGSPEQWLPKRFGQTGPWTDVYGLAITLVEVVSGQCPIDGDQMAMMAQALDVHHRPTPKAANMMLGEAVEAVFSKALAVDPKDRYHSIGEFWSALGKAAAGESSAVPDLGSAKPVADGKERDAFGNVIEPRAVKEQKAPASPRPAAQARPKAPAAPAPSSGSPRSPRIPTSQNYLLGKTVDSFDDDLAPPQPIRAAELDGIGLMPKGVVQAGPIRTREKLDIKPAKPRKDFTQPILWLVVSVGLMMADWAYTRFVGEALRIGPVRMLWVAGPLALAGFALLLVRVFAEE
jgi:serine/threonine-protein kinase